MRGLFTALVPKRIEPRLSPEHGEVIDGGAARMTPCDASRSDSSAVIASAALPSVRPADEKARRKF